MHKRYLGMMMIGLALLGSGCAHQEYGVQDSAVTPGMAKKYIYPGKTTQTDVLEIFGPPDLVTRRDGKEVWTYDKISQEVESSSGFLTIFIAGYSGRHVRSSTRSTMLMVYYDTKDVVADYALSAARF